jgi:hypothetical protein
MKTQQFKKGDYVTPIDEKADKDNSTNIEHSFFKGDKLLVERESPFVSKDGTKNFWCKNTDGYQQLMNEKEIISYE